MDTKTKATVKDLYNLPEDSKAEIVNGEVRLMSPTGGKSGRASTKIVISLSEYERRRGGGYAFGDNVGFIVRLPHRQSFSPDAAFHVGELSMRFLEGASIFAAEVRSEGNYGPAAEKALAQKRADYFAAGTLVVWDVDLLSEDVVRVYRADSPETPTLYGRGDEAEAEPALPGWSMPVDDLFDQPIR